MGLCPFNVDVESNQAEYWNSLIETNSKTYLNLVSDSPLNCFDYQEAISQWNISYIVIRDFASIPRFSDDPTFTLVFKNEEVSIFKVTKT